MPGEGKNGIRTFLAVELDDVFLDETAALADRLRGGFPFAPIVGRAGRAGRAGAVRWADRAQMHVTLRFFGPTTSDQVLALRDFVADVPSLSRSFGARVSLLTGFPDVARAHVVVLELESDALTALAGRAERRAVELGFAAEERAYRPHVTLARSKRAIDVRNCAPTLALPEARITALVLHASTPGANGPVYAPLARVELAR